MTFSQFIYGGSSSLSISLKNRIMYDFCVEIWWDIIQLKRDVSDGGMRWKNCRAKHYFMTVKWELWEEEKQLHNISMSCTLNCILALTDRDLLLWLQCGKATYRKSKWILLDFLWQLTRFVALCVIVDLFFYWIQFTQTPRGADDAKRIALSRCRYAIKKL